MRRLIKKLSIFTAIILCIMTVFAAGGTPVRLERHCHYDTQFFAMPVFSFSFVPAPSDLLSAPNKKSAVTWLKEKVSYTEDNSVYNLSESSFLYKINYNLNFDLDLTKTNLYNPQKNALYYMRI